MTIYDKTAATYAKQRENKLREQLRAEFGDRKYRIIDRGAATEVHVYGRLPNSTETGWWILGGIKEAESRYNI